MAELNAISRLAAAIAGSSLFVLLAGGCSDRPVEETRGASLPVVLGQLTLSDEMSVSTSARKWMPIQPKAGDTACSGDECLVVWRHGAQAVALRTTADGRPLEDQVLVLGASNAGKWLLAAGPSYYVVVLDSSPQRLLRIARASSHSAKPIEDLGDVPFGEYLIAVAASADRALLVSCGSPRFGAAVLSLADTNVQDLHYTELPSNFTSCLAFRQVVAADDQFLLLGPGSVVRVSSSGALLDSAPLVFAPDFAQDASAILVGEQYVLTWTLAGDVFVASLPAGGAASDAGAHPTLNGAVVAHDGDGEALYYDGRDVLLLYDTPLGKGGVRLDPATLERRVPGSDKEFDMPWNRSVIHYGPSGSLAANIQIIDLVALEVPATPGAPLIGEERLLAPTGAYQQSVVTASNGETYIVAWLEYEPDFTGNISPRALVRRWDAATRQPLDHEPLLVAQLQRLFFDEQKPIQVSAAGDRYVIAWLDEFHVYTRSLSSDGTLGAVSEQALSDAGRVQSAPGLVCTPGECLIAWMGDQPDTRPRLRASRLDPVTLTEKSTTLEIGGIRETSINHIAAAVQPGAAEDSYRLAWAEHDAVRTATVPRNAGEPGSVETVVSGPPGAVVESVSLAASPSTALVGYDFGYLHGSEIASIDPAIGRTNGPARLLVNAGSHAPLLVYDGQRFIARFLLGDFSPSTYLWPFSNLADAFEPSARAASFTVVADRRRDARLRWNRDQRVRLPGGRSERARPSAARSFHHEQRRSGRGRGNARQRRSLSGR